VNLSPGGEASVDGGTLLLGGYAAEVLDALTAVNVGSATTAATLNLGGESVSVSNLTGTSAGRITDTGAAATLSVVESSSAAFNGSLSNGTGVLSLNEVSTGSATTLTLTAASTYTGATTIGAGQTLALSFTGAIAHTAISIGQGATFDISGLTATSTSVLSLAGVDTTSAVNVDGKSLTVTAESSSPTLLFEGSTGTTASHLAFDTTASSFSLANALFSNWASTHSTILIDDTTANATITGSSVGANYFYFNAPSVGEATVTDFSAAQGDFIGVSHIGFAALGLSAGQVLPAADFTVGPGPVGTNAQFVWNSGVLSYAASGTSGTEVALAALTGVTTLTASNIHIF
jgi:hypothetical protein